MLLLLLSKSINATKFLKIQIFVSVYSNSQGSGEYHYDCNEYSDGYDGQKESKDFDEIHYDSIEYVGENDDQNTPSQSSQGKN